MHKIIVAALLCTALPAFADEGMWTYNNFPSDKVAQKYGFTPEKAWLDKVRLGSARLAQGCSASFVSPDGLVMTNHRCARRCVEEQSTKKSDILANGFVATKTADEKQCPLPALKQSLFSKAPVYPELKEATLAFGLTKLREQLGPDHAVVKKVFGKKSPATLARELVKGTKLADVSNREELFEGGQKAIDASKDPMILLARLVDGDARAVRKRDEDEVQSGTEKESETIAKARFDAFGTSV